MTTPRRRLAGSVVVVTLSVLAAGLILRGQQNDSEIAAPAPVSADGPSAVQFAAPPSELPEADLRTALNVACAKLDPDSADQAWTQDEIQAQADVFKKLKANLSERLSVSPSAEHLHLAALLEDDPATRVALLDRAISRSPSDPFLIWDAVRICSESGKPTPCPLRDWEQHLISVDGQNSESWIRVAANRYAERDYDAALDAMRHASAAAESRAYWTESIEMIERGLAAGSDYAFQERAGMAFGLAASELPRYGDYVRMCKEQSAINVDWAHACLAYGELLEKQGKTEIGISIAILLQKLALEALGQVEKVAEMEQRRQARRKERLGSIKDYNPAIERLILSNTILFSAYLAKVRSEGEEAARQYISVEVGRLLEQQPELACE